MADSWRDGIVLKVIISHIYTPKANKLTSPLPHGHFSFGLYTCIRPALAYLL